VDAAAAYIERKNERERERERESERCMCDILPRRCRHKAKKNRKEE
jgi:hypothetical protein